VEFSVADYLPLALTAIEEVASRNRVPILVGGTGLYFKALLYGLDAYRPPDPELRRELNSLTKEDLLLRLQRLDPAAPAQLDIDNPRRLIRAIEIITQSGQSLATSRSAWKGDPRPHLGFLAYRDRPDLDQRITLTVSAMLEGGAVEEVRALLPTIGTTASAAIGFRTIARFLEDGETLAAVAQTMVLDTRRYAKRQMTWFRNQLAFTPLNLAEPEPALMAAIEKALADA